jgi:hypothetical protein
MIDVSGDYVDEDPRPVRCHDRRYRGGVWYEPELGFCYQVDAPDGELVSCGDGYRSVSALIRDSKGVIDWESEVLTVAWLREAPERADQEENPDRLVRKVLTEARTIRLKAS